MSLPEPPERYKQFVERFPHLASAWESIHRAGSEGPLDERTARLVKLGVGHGGHAPGIRSRRCTEGAGGRYHKRRDPAGRGAVGGYTGHAVHGSCLFVGR